MLYDDILCLVESGRQQIKEVRRKVNRKTWKQRQLLSKSGFVLRIAPPPLSRDSLRRFLGIKMKKIKNYSAQHEFLFSWWITKLRTFDCLFEKLALEKYLYDLTKMLYTVVTKIMLLSWISWLWRVRQKIWATFKWNWLLEVKVIWQPCCEARKAISCKRSAASFRQHSNHNNVVFSNLQVTSNQNLNFIVLIIRCV